MQRQVSATDATMVRKGRRGPDLDVLQAALRLAERGKRSTEIAVLLANDPKFRGRAPATRTVQRWVKHRLPPEDASGPWTLASSSGPAGGLILPVVAAVQAATAGRVAVTQDQAPWLLRIRRSVPDMPLLAAWEAAIGYLRNRPADVLSLDALLAWAPWRSPEAMDRFLGFVLAHRPGWVWERRVVGDEPGPIPSAGRLKGIRGLSGIDGIGRYPGVDGVGHPVGVVLRPVGPGAGQPAIADLVGTTAGVAIALEISAGMEEEGATDASAMETPS